MEDVILISDEYKEIKDFSNKNKNSKINVLTIDPKDLKGLQKILSFKNINIINLVDMYNEEVVNQTIKDIHKIDSIIEGIFGTCCHQWGTLCDGNYLDGPILNINILVFSIKQFLEFNNIESIYIGKSSLIKSKKDKYRIKKILTSFNINSKIKFIRNRTFLDLLYIDKIYLIEILRLCLFLYNLFVSFFQKKIQLKNSYQYMHVVRSLAYKHSSIKKNIFLNLNEMNFKTLLITFDINVFRANKLFGKNINIFPLESQLNFKILISILNEYLFFMFQLIRNNSKLKKRLIAEIPDKYYWILSSLCKYSISELLKRLFFEKTFKSLKSEFNIINPWGPPESGYYEIVTRVSEVYKTNYHTLLAYFCS